MMYPPPRSSRSRLSKLYLAVILSLGFPSIQGLCAENFSGSPDQYIYKLFGDYKDIKVVNQQGSEITKSNWEGYNISLSGHSESQLASVNDLKLIELAAQAPHDAYTLNNNSTFVDRIDFDNQSFGVLYIHFSGSVDVDASENVFEIKDSVFKNFKGITVQGSGDKKAENNTMTMCGGIAEGGTPNGGRYGNLGTVEITSHDDSAELINNKLYLYDGTVTGTATAGLISTHGATYARAEGNIAEFKGDSYAQMFFGAQLKSYSDSTIVGTNNKATYDSSSTEKTNMVAAIYADGSSQSKPNITLTNNNAYIKGAALINSAIGAYAFSQGGGEINTAGNGLEITGNSVISSAYGSWATSYASSSDSGAVTVEQNHLTATAGTITAAYGGRATSDSSAKSFGNTAEISGVAKVTTLYGGSATNHNFGLSAQAIENSVKVLGGEVETVYGGFVKNTSTKGVIADLLSNGNIVELSSGVVNNLVYGGYAEGEGKTIQTRNNTVALKGNINLMNTSLYGGSHEAIGNRLEVSGFTGTVKSIDNFETIHFDLFDDTIEYSGAILTVSDKLSTDARVDVSMQVTKSLEEGKIVTLVEGNGADELKQGTISFVDPIYEVEASFDNSTDNQLNLTLGNKSVSTDTTVLNAGQIAAAMDLDRGVNLLVNYFDSDFNVKNGLFVIAGGGKEKFERNGSLDTKGYNAVFGYSGQYQTQNAKYTVGLFLDYGDGSYEADNGGFAEGDFRHYGVGFYGGIQTGQFFADASLRAGQAQTEFTSVLNNIFIGQDDTARSYVGAHLGFGYSFLINANSKLSPYFRYFITHLGSNTESIPNNEVKWEGFTMQKTVLGAAFESSVSNHLSTRFDAGWEYIFDADSQITFGQGGKRVDDYKGHNLFLQAAMQHTINENLSWGLQLQGRVGSYVGVTGLVNMVYQF